MDSADLFLYHFGEAREAFLSRKVCYLVDGTPCKIIRICGASICIELDGTGLQRYLYYSESGACWNNAVFPEELPCVIYRKTNLDILLSVWFPSDLHGLIYNYLPIISKQREIVSKQ